MESIFSPPAGVVIDVAGEGLPLLVCTNDTIIKPRLPAERMKSALLDAFRAARLKLPDDGTQRMGAQCC